MDELSFRRRIYADPNDNRQDIIDACDIIIGEAGLTPRATKDIDMILVMEAFNDDFVKQFWKFFLGID